ncbi:hypothetical protein ACOMHN_016170 [Nucella lapillus]
MEVDMANVDREEQFPSVSETSVVVESNEPSPLLDSELQSPGSPSETVGLQSPESPSETAGLQSPESPSETAGLQSPESPSETVGLQSPETPSETVDSNSSPSASDFAKPDDELQDKIIKQVEFYFSDVNIVKDAFLMKHVQSNKMGYVNMNLIASFKRVKHLTRDRRVVAYSLRNSTALEVNEKGTKLRRLAPLPEYDGETPFRTVMATNLKQKTPTIDSVTEEFSQCPGVALIRIIRPQQLIPSDVKKFAYNHREIGMTMCALIEFQTEEQAKNACKTMSNTDDWRSGRRVVLLTHKKNHKPESKAENGRASPDSEKKGPKKDNTKSRKKTRVDQNPEKNSSYSNGGDACPRNPTDSGDRNPSPPNGGHRRNGQRTSVKKDGSPGESSPWLQRRRQAAEDGAATFDGASQNPRSSRVSNMVVVLRAPKGPDGTRGFHAGLERGKPQCNTIA